MTTAEPAAPAARTRVTGPAGGRWREAAALSAVGAGALHLVVALEHAHDGPLYTLFFLVAGAAQVTLGMLVLRRPHPVGIVAGLAGTVALLLLYLASRTTGLPFDAHGGAPEDPGLLGVAVVLTQLVTLAALPTLLTGAWRSRSVNAVLAVGVVVWLLWALLVLVAEPLRVASDSMSPTLAAGQHVLVLKVAAAPARGDLVVVAAPDGALLLKRLVAVGGDRVEVRDGVLQVNGRPIDEPYVDYEREDGMFFGPKTVPAGHLFLLGDNREVSVDSRDFGAVPVGDLVGTVPFRRWPRPGPP